MKYVLCPESGIFSPGRPSYQGLTGKQVVEYLGQGELKTSSHWRLLNEVGKESIIPSSATGSTESPVLVQNRALPKVIPSRAVY